MVGESGVKLNACCTIEQTAKPYGQFSSGYNVLILFILEAGVLRVFLIVILGWNYESSPVMAQLYRREVKLERIIHMQLFLLPVVQLRIDPQF